MPIAQTGLSITADQGQQKPLEVASNLSEGLKAGMQLATVQDQVDSMKAKVEEQKLELQQKQFSSVTSMLKNLAIANPKVGKLMTPKVKENMIKMGFDPNIADLITSDDASRARFVNIANAASGKIANDPQALAEALQAYADIGEFDKGLSAFENAAKMKQQNSQFYAGLQNQKDIAAASAERAASKQGAQEDKDYKQAMRLIGKDLDSATRKDRESLADMQNARALLDGEGIAQAAGQRALAKAFNSGALTDADVESLSGNKALASRFAQLVQTAADGKLTEQNIAELKGIVDTIEPIRRKRVESITADYAKRFTDIYGGDVEQVKNTLGYPNLMGSMKTLQEPSVPASSKTQGGFDQAKFQEALQRQIKARQGK